jgi:hypothetical protein
MRKPVWLVSCFALLVFCLTASLWAQQGGQNEHIEKLKSGDSSIREEGVEEIAKERSKVVRALIAILNAEGIMAVNQADLIYAEKGDANIYDNVAKLEHNRSVGVAAIEVLADMRAEEAAELLAQYIYFRARTPSKSNVRLARESMPTEKDWPAVVALMKIGKVCTEPMMSVYLKDLSVGHYLNVETVLLNILGSRKHPPEEYNDRTIDQHELHTLNKRLSAHSFISSYLLDETDDVKRAKLQVILDSLKKGVSAQKEYYKEHYGREFPAQPDQPPDEQPHHENTKPQIATSRQIIVKKTTEWLVIPLVVLSVVLAGAVVFLLLRRK